MILFVWLREILKDGFPDKIDQLPESVKPFWNFRFDLFLTGDGVLWYKDRVVIPGKLKQRVLDVLHSAHQGVVGMNCRAQSCFGN